MIFAKRWQHLYKLDRWRIPPTPEGELRLHRLERPVPWPDSVWPLIDKINLYPSYPPLIKRISAHVGVPDEQIVLGAGIEDLVRNLVLLCCDPGDGFAFSWPTCQMFDVYARVFDTKAYRLVTNPRVGLSAEHVASYANQVKLILLPNPGQPVETCFTVDELRFIAGRLHHYGNSVLAIDEAYFGFGAPTALPLIKEFDNVVILRTFSKAFGAAGIRVGYALGQERVIKPLDAIRLSGEIAGPSMRAASRLLAHYPDIVEPGVREIIAGRDWLREQLVHDGFDASGKYANHVLVDLKTVGKMRQVRDGLIAVGVHVKGGFPAPLASHLLITAGPLDMMQEFYSRFTMAAMSGATEEEVA